MRNTSTGLIRRRMEVLEVIQWRSPLGSGSDWDFATWTYCQFWLKEFGYVVLIEVSF